MHSPLWVIRNACQEFLGPRDQVPSRCHWVTGLVTAVSLLASPCIPWKTVGRGVYIMLIPGHSSHMGSRNPADNMLPIRKACFPNTFMESFSCEVQGSLCVRLKWVSAPGEEVSGGRESLRKPSTMSGRRTGRGLHAGLSLLPPAPCCCPLFLGLAPVLPG